MILAAPTPWKEALASLRSRELLPTTLSSAQLKQIDAELLRRSVFSAKVQNFAFLDRVAEVMGKSDVIRALKPEAFADEKFGAITVKNGRAEQANFDTYDSMRIKDMPKVEAIVMPSGGFWGGVGEPTIAVAAPAVLNAIFAATGKRIRDLPITAELLELARAAGGADLVFPSKAGTPFNDRTLRKHLNDAIAAHHREHAALTIPDFRVHDFRHTCASNILRLGCSLDYERALLGHAPEHITAHYARPDAEVLRPWIERWSRVVLGLPPPAAARAPDEPLAQ